MGDPGFLSLPAPSPLSLSLPPLSIPPSALSLPLPARATCPESSALFPPTTRCCWGVLHAGTRAGPALLIRGLGTLHSGEQSGQTGFWDRRDSCQLRPVLPASPGQGARGSSGSPGDGRGMSFSDPGDVFPSWTACGSSYGALAVTCGRCKPEVPMGATGQLGRASHDLAHNGSRILVAAASSLSLLPCQSGHGPWGQGVRRPALIPMWLRTARVPYLCLSAPICWQRSWWGAEMAVVWSPGPWSIYTPGGTFLLCARNCFAPPGVGF